MIIDMILNDTAYIEKDDGKIIKMPAELLPKNAKEGDVLIIATDKEKTEERRKNIKNKMNLLFRD